MKLHLCIIELELSLCCTPSLGFQLQIFSSAAQTSLLDTQTLLTKRLKEAVTQERWWAVGPWAEDPHAGVRDHYGRGQAWDVHVPMWCLQKGMRVWVSSLLPPPWHQLLQAALCRPVLVACFISSEDFVNLSSSFLSALPKLFVGSFLQKQI